MLKLLIICSLSRTGILNLGYLLLNFMRLASPADTSGFNCQ